MMFTNFGSNIKTRRQYINYYGIMKTKTRIIENDQSILNNANGIDLTWIFRIDLSLKTIKDYFKFIENILVHH